MAKPLTLCKLGVLVPVCFGTRLGVSLAVPKGISKQMGFEMASSLSFSRGNKRAVL